MWKRLVRAGTFFILNGIQGKKIKGEFNFPQVNQQARQMDEVAWCIMNEKPMRVTGEEGVKDMIVVEKIWESIAQGGKTMKIWGFILMFSIPSSF